MAGTADRTAPSGVRGRWGRAALAVLGTGLAAGLAACGTPTPGFTPKPVVTITPSVPPKPTPSVTPSVTATPTPTPIPSSAGVKGTGSLALFSPVTKGLAGTCRTTGGAPTITLAEKTNDFFDDTTVKLVLTPAKSGLASALITFDDREGFSWKLAYSATAPVKGTSAKLVAKGRTYTLSGKLQAEETRKGKTITEITPVTVVATCAGSDW